MTLHSVSCLVIVLYSLPSSSRFYLESWSRTHCLTPKQFSRFDSWENLLEKSPDSNECVARTGGRVLLKDTQSGSDILLSLLPLTPLPLFQSPNKKERSSTYWVPHEGAGTKVAGKNCGLPLSDPDSPEKPLFVVFGWDRPDPCLPWRELSTPHRES